VHNISDQRVDAPQALLAARRRVALWALAGLALASVLATGLTSMAGGAPAVLAHIHQTLLALQDRPVILAAGFVVWALVANCLVVPAGSLSMIVGGAVLGPLVPAVTWTVAQLITAPLLYSLIRRGVSRMSVPPHPLAARLVRLALSNGFKATALLRLMPIMPNAPATCWQQRLASSCVRFCSARR
jgi:uncharacterized membrane protein YdjX (TVP38/TMEM64 family)